MGATPGSIRPGPDDIRRGVHALCAALSPHLPRHVPPTGSEWDFYGPAMISRMIDTVESALALMADDRAVDGAVLVRVLYEHVVKFCWISIDPAANYPAWQMDSEFWDRKLHNDALAIGVLGNDGTPVVAELRPLGDVAQLALAVDRYWSERISAFTAPTTGPGALVTFRGLYLLAYRNASEAVHGRPSVLDAYMSRGSELWRMGADAASTSMFWPLIVPLFAWALLVCHEQWGWPDPELVIAANNSMYGFSSIRSSGWPG